MQEVMFLLQDAASKKKTGRNSKKDLSIILKNKMTKKDYYEILGVSKDATKEDIRKAYKKLAKKYHPDVNKSPDAEQKFKEINEAASVLADERKREQYDRFGSAEGIGGFDFRGFDFGGGFGGINFDEIFEMFTGGFNPFGRRSRRQGPVRGDDLVYELEVSLEDAVFGSEKEILVPALVLCEKCKGTGAEDPDDIEACKDCDGSGYVKRSTRTPFGIFATTSSCRTCGGTGKYIKNLCDFCDGEGRVTKNNKIKVEIPAGVHNGTRLRLAGKGEAGLKGGRHGDLYIIIRVKEHPVFERRNNDIHVSVPVSFAQAALGSEIEVPTLKSKAKLKIPAGTQTNTLFKLKGKGVPNLRGYGTGDQLVRVVVEVPKKLSAKQKKLLKEFDSSLEKKKFKLFK
ncbi:molecular chaperone DnaJ [Candidatus Woesearchaeota archaeon]|nr:molecular chaperone DnaJ [Candidatus Woesearchaeota archaeon]